MLNFSVVQPEKKTISIGECSHGDVVMDSSGDIMVVMHLGRTNRAYLDGKVWVVYSDEPSNLVFHDSKAQVTLMTHLEATMTVQ